MRNVQEPKERSEPGPTGGTVSEHPAYGQISAHRIQGTQVLYGSDFLHHNCVRINISRSTLRRDLSHDWYYPHEELIEVDLSEAQWATFVSAMNQGSGPCCTIRHIDRKSVPELPDPKSRVDQFNKEVGEKLGGCLSEISDTLTHLDELGLPKGKAKAIREHLEHIQSELTCNLDFAAESFSKHAEETVEKAKTEVHGWMTNAIQRAGIAALQGHLPLAIESKKGENDDAH